jgi:CheY-like chemotaxis protein
VAVEAVEPIIKERNHRLSVNREGLSIYVRADKVRLTQCIANLLTNAAKFTPPNGEIHISSGIKDGHAVIQVTDTGIGIAAELLPTLFDLFVQGHRSLDRSEGGLGIGLSVVKQLIEMHGGQVSGSSAGVGRGATFAIHLPPASAEAAPGELQSEQTNVRRRILVVDDNTDAADSMADLLESDGHQAKAVYTPEEGLMEVERFKPDLVLLDIGLPRMSGYDVVQRIKAVHPGMFVAALSGYGRSEDRQQAAAAGFDAHLVKPVDFDALKQLMNRVGALTR